MMPPKKPKHLYSSKSDIRKFFKPMTREPLQEPTSHITAQEFLRIEEKNVPTVSVVAGCPQSPSTSSQTHFQVSDDTNDDDAKTLNQNSKTFPVAVKFSQSSSLVGQLQDEQKIGKPQKSVSTVTMLQQPLHPTEGLQVSTVESDQRSCVSHIVVRQDTDPAHTSLCDYVDGIELPGGLSSSVFAISDLNQDIEKELKESWNQRLGIDIDDMNLTESEDVDFVINQPVEMVVEMSTEDDVQSISSSMRTMSFGSTVPKSLDRLSGSSCESIGTEDNQISDFDSEIQLDLCQDELKKQIIQHIASLRVSLEERNLIERTTIGQSNSKNWYKHRRFRITASIAGDIHKMKHGTSIKSNLERILYPNENLNHLEAFRYGKENENYAKKAYENIKRAEGLDVKVSPCGLFISLEDPYLAASPDGMVGEDGIIEIKCPISMYGKDPHTMPGVKKDSYLVLNSNGTITLKKNHNYYYQIIMQLYCSKKSWCDFVVYSYKVEDDRRVDFPLVIQRIWKTIETDNVWETLRAKLRNFYVNVVAPEIVDSRKKRRQPYRPRLQLSI